MPDSPAESASAAWKVPECPFAIEYVPRVLDDIRLAVMDAFFSLPRGGAEIGGILLGRHAEGRVTVTEYLAMDCEHATGPSFVLSHRDEAKLEELLKGVQANPVGFQPVGWYHSHTRSEVFLSEADREIHKRYFPEPWQVALVLKPHTFQPMRCGFFFCEPDGSMHAAASYQEFTLEAMPLRPVPTGVVPPMTAHASPILHREPDGTRAAINVTPQAVAVPAHPPVAPVPAVPAATGQAAAVPAPPVPETVLAPVDPPKFATAAQEDRSWLWLQVLMSLGIGLVVAGVGFQTRELWLPMLRGEAKPAAILVAAPAPVPVLALSTTDTDGQLQIRWDGSSAAVQQGTGAVLTINDGSTAPKEIRLDQEHLRSGSLTYSRESEQVDIKLVVSEPNGQPTQAVTGFVGKMPSKPAAPAPGDTPARKSAQAEIARLKSDLDAQVHKVEKLMAGQSLLVSQSAKAKTELAAANDRLANLQNSLSEAQAKAAEAAKLRKDLAAANDRNKKLSKSLTDAQNELKRQQRKRLGTQDPGK
ncbi:Mov34/MPN/PAD-1 family protein [Candidatus Sulfopaludibacter sp. SbA3]|nr:Mov34/MPN/PAD-1 family protein [Candidatus Sulfopaludibacter sp. SbA3]